MAGLRWLVFPCVLVASVASAIALTRSGLGPGLSTFAVIFASVIPLLVLEPLIPMRPEWRRDLFRSATDVVHTLITGLSTDLFRAASFGAMLVGATWISGGLGQTLWPNHWPVAAQLALALIIGDFGAYWVHRTAHMGPLWRIHAMHHTSDQLSTLSSGRNHPLNAIAAYGSQVTPLVLLGAGTEALVALSVFTAVHGMLQHANLDFHHGWLNYVFMTADNHRWHHSERMSESNTNFGSNIALWDHVFGTFVLRAPEGPHAVGLDDVEMPNNVWVHLATPFTLPKWTRPEVDLGRASGPS